MDGVSAAFDFVIEGVKYVFNAVVQFVQDSFDMIESILATVYDSVAHFFERTFEWLGFLFNWDDILRTHEALAYTFQQGLDFVPLAVPEVKRLADDGFRNIQAGIDHAFADLKSRVTGATLGGYGETNRRSDPKFMHSVGNNFVMTGVTNNAAGARQIGGSSAAIDTTVLNDFLADLQSFAQNASTTNQFVATRNYMEQVGSNTDNIFTQLFSNMLDLAHHLVNALVSGVHALVNKALDALATVVSLIKDFLVKEWDIPFVTAFYRWITTDANHPNGSPLSVLDVLSLVIAIPVTTIYKITNNKAPFPDQQSLNDFKGLFNANQMLANFKKSLNRDEAANEVALGDPMSAWKGFLAWSTASAAFFGWASSAVSDIMPPNQPFPGDEALGKITLGFECAASFFSFPWFTAPFAAPHWAPSNEPADPEGAANAGWLYGTIVGLAVDGGWLTLSKFKKLPSSDDWGLAARLSVLWGALCAGNACRALPRPGRSALVPNFTKVGRWTLIAIKYPVSLLVVGLTDTLRLHHPRSHGSARQHRSSAADGLGRGDTMTWMRF